ncbi:YdcF family protein [Palleronia abyssalis]|nr:YdcF family protein [Palleronia abyssalis]
MLWFILGKLVWLVLRPESWLIALLAAAFWGAIFRRLGVVRWCLAGALAFVLGVGMLPVDDWVIAPLEGRHPRAPDIDGLDGIVVLGGGEDAGASTVWGSPQLAGGAERFVEAMALTRRFPDARVVVSGGSGALMDLRNDGTVQRDIAESFFAGQGLDQARLTVERMSRNTSENARNTTDLLAGERAGTWVLVTSAFHMPRALKSFRRAGWDDIVPWPVDYRSGPARGLEWNFADNLGGLTVALKEYVGLAAYAVLGR